MEQVGSVPEIEKLKQRLYGLLTDAPHNSLTMIHYMQVEGLALFLSGRGEWLTYAILEHEKSYTPPLSRTEEQKKDVINKFLELEKINEIPSAGKGYSSVTAYKTKFERVFVISSTLVRKDDSKVIAWNLARVNPGEEGNYTWLPEGYFDTARS